MDTTTKMSSGFSNREPVLNQSTVFLQLVCGRMSLPINFSPTVRFADLEWKKNPTSRPVTSLDCNWRAEEVRGQGLIPLTSLDCKLASITQNPNQL